jgi:hypothetical protein
MKETKPAIQSLTVVSATASALLGMLGALGVVKDPVLAGQAIDGAVQLTSAALALVAIVGRMRATTRIGKN